MKKDWFIWSILQILGLLLLTLGVSGFIASGLGAGAIDAFVFGFYRLTFNVLGLDQGVWNFIINILLMITLLLLTRNPKILLSAVVVFVMSLFISLWLTVLQKIFNYDITNVEAGNLLTSGQVFNAIWVAILALLTMAFAVALLIRFKGILSPYDEAAIYLEGKFNNYAIGKIVLDGTFMVGGLILGIINKAPFEQVGIFSIIIVVGLGPLISLFLKLLEKGGEVENEIE